MSRFFRTSTGARRFLAAVAAAAVAPSALALIDTRIDGLPAGLNLTIKAEQVRCDGGQPLLAQLGLTEQTTTSWETVPQPGGGFKLVQRTRTAYVGQFSLPLPLSRAGCSFDPAARFFLGVLGQSDNGPAMRWGMILASVSPASLTTLHQTMEAKTTSLNATVSVNGQSQNVGTPTAIVRGQLQRWHSSHRDSMNESSVADPALEFLVQTNQPFFGAMASVGRISIDRDGRVCVRASGSTVCRTRAQGGTVAHGGIEADVSDTQHTALSNSANTSWRFRLTNSFPAGTVTARVSADDVDPFDYLVDGVPTALHLLPWKSLSVPVQVN